MAPAYLLQAPTGIPGAVTRPDETNIEPIMLVGVGGTVFPTAQGIPLKYVAGGAQQFNGGAETAPLFAGVLIREVPGISGSSADDAVFFPTAPNPEQVQGMAVRGYVNVLCVAGTPVRGGVVYVQIIANGPIPVGAFRADSTDGGNAIALTATQAEWAADGLGPDGNGGTTMAELRIAR